jgi:hypothetical protein
MAMADVLLAMANVVAMAVVFQQAMLVVAVAVKMVRVHKLLKKVLAVEMV